MRPSSDPKILRARSTATEAMETEFEPIPVSRARLFGGGEGALQQLFQLPGDRARSARHREGLFHLAQNLRLAHHHRIKARGHAEEVAHRLLVAVLVEVRAEN